MKIFLSIVSSVGLLSSVALAAEWQYVMPESGDLTTTNLIGEEFAVPTANLSREAVDFSYRLDPAQSIAFAQPTFVQQSQQYWLDVTAGQLAQGVELPISAPGAVVRISPLSAQATTFTTQAIADAKSAAAVIDIGSVQISQQGRSHSATAAIETFANAEQLRAAGLDFSEQTVAFKLDDRFEKGQVTLQVNALAGVTAKYIVNVFEPHSSQILELKAPQRQVMFGEAGRIELRGVGISGLSADEISGYLQSPDGLRTKVLSFQQRDGIVEGYFSTTDLGNDAQGLWEVQTFLQRDNGPEKLLRDAKTAIAITAPTARVSGAISATTNRYKIGVEAIAPGRYEIRAILFASDTQNQLVPAMALHSARWLDPGEATISLSFDSAQLSAAGLGAPFELRHLEMKDQSRMGDLWRQQIAFRSHPIDAIGPRPVLEEIE